MHLYSLCHVLVTRYESLRSLYLYSRLIVYSDLCCVFSLNYCFAAVVLIATNKVECAVGIGECAVLIKYFRP